MIRVFVVEEHPVVRVGVHQILTRASLTVTGDAATATEALHRLQSLGADVLLLGTESPLPSLREVLIRVSREHGGLPVVVFGLYSDELYAAETIRAGAAAYVSQREMPERLVEAIRGAARREPSPGRSPDIDEGAEPARSGNSSARLTERELQVLILLCGGRTPKETAHALRISPKTVSAHRANILRKLKLRNTVDLIRYALRHGLVH